MKVTIKDVSPTNSQPLSAWTSSVTSTKVASTGSGTFMPQQYPTGVSTPANPYYTPAGGSMPNPYVTTPQQPTDGMIAYIAGKVYRYSDGKNEWHEVVNAPTSEIAEAPVLPVELDARAMLDALRQYAEFLEDLDGMDQRYADVVSDTLFGLGEAIEALERLDQA